MAHFSPVILRTISETRHFSSSRCRQVSILLSCSLLFQTIVIQASVVQVEECLLRKGIDPSNISPAGTESFNTSLSNCLIQDPLAQPLLYTRPMSREDVRSVIICAKETEFVFCARGGGHSWSSSSTCPGIVLDMSNLNGFSTNSANTKLTIGAGRTIGETLYQLYTSKNRIIPVGACPSVGVGGYIQGGGLGTLSAVYGLLADNVVRLKGVTPEGSFFTATRKRNEDLFWALRGAGGGYLGIVTEYTTRTFEVGRYDENVYFMYVWTEEYGADALYEWTKYAVNNTGETYIRMATRTSKRGLSIRAKGICWKVTSTEACEARLAKLSLWSVPGRRSIILEKPIEQGFMEAQKFFTADGGFGTRKPSDSTTNERVFTQKYTSKSFLSDKSWGSSLWGPGIKSTDREYFQGILDIMKSGRVVANMRAIGMELYPFGAKAAAREDTFSAFPYRNTTIGLAVFYTGGETPARSAIKSRLQSHLGSFQIGTYINYLDLDLENYPDMYWGDNLSRMRELKKTYDPANRLWHTQPLNI